jgi:sterol desaturase/sphingolipid hydroxylase (fatty acid hydroxylase superfamily)
MNEIWGIQHFDAKGVAIVLLFFGVMEALMGAYQHSKRTKWDYLTELVSFTQLSILIQPGIVLFVGWLGHSFFPQLSGVYQPLSPIVQFVILVGIEDLPQYWWHRLAHRHYWLWKLHLAHHASPSMGIGTAFRNAALYYLLMPNIWLAAVAVYLGFGKVYLVYTVVKMLIVIGAHSEVRWDKWLYETRWLRPLAWLLERTISTPATHFAHHGFSDKDGISNGNGNYSNMFFFWDILFGTAKITRQYPSLFGAESATGELPWYALLYYPFMRSKDKNSTLK